MIPTNFPSSMTSREPTFLSAISANGIAYRCVRTNGPQALALSFKKMSYGHGAPPCFSLSVAFLELCYGQDGLVLSWMIQAAATNPPKNRATRPRSTQELELCQTH